MSTEPSSWGGFYPLDRGWVSGRDTKQKQTKPCTCDHSGMCITNCYIAVTRIAYLIKNWCEDQRPRLYSPTVILWQVQYVLICS